jgi:histidyl-tRNA synthetase
MPIETRHYGYATAVATSLRESGIATMLYSESDAMKKKLRFADRMGFSYVLVIGDAEIEAQKVNFKDMTTGASSVETIEFISETISNR